MKKIFKKWKKIAGKVANFQIRLLLFLVYFIVITPVGVFVILFKDYLKIKKSPLWQKSKDIFSIFNFFTKQ